MAKYIRYKKMRAGPLACKHFFYIEDMKQVYAESRNATEAFRLRKLQ